MAKVAIYLRLSDEDRDKKFKTDESESIQNQKSMLRDYCAERNWEIYDIYCDEDYSGIDKNRPDFNRMIKDCEARKIDIVLCKSQSRFSRDMEMIEKYIHNKFIEWGVRFISIVDHADSNDVSNKKARQINGLINEWYLEDASENIRKTLKHKREQGEFTGSFAPYGYLIDPDNKNHLVVDEKTAPIVQDIFNWYNQGWGYRRIVMELNNRNIPNPSTYKHLNNSNYVNKKEEESRCCGLWTHSTVYRIIRNELYTGTLVQGKSHNVSYKNKQRVNVPKEDWIRVPNTHEAIITMDTWKMTQERLKGRERTSKITMELSPLGGKVRCALCGSPMSREVWHDKNKTKTYYGLTCKTYKVGAMNCSNRSQINGAVLESIIVEQLNKYISSYCQMDLIVLEKQKSDTSHLFRDMLKSYEEKIHINELKIADLYDDKLEGVITKEQYLMFSRKYTDEIDELSQKCEAIKTQIEQMEDLSKHSTNIRDVLKRYEHIDTLTRDVADEFIDCVYVGEKEDGKDRKITINWKF